MIQLNDLEKFFNERELPKGKFEISNGETTENLKSVIDNHISFLRNNPKNRGYLPYFKRLLIIYKKIKK